MPEEMDVTPESEATCGVEMWGFKRCGRAIYPAAAHDDGPVCLMHSDDPAKSVDQFHVEVERILADAEQGDDVADFQAFVFPAFYYVNRLFKSRCEFSRAKFTEAADFRWAKFSQSADFRGAKFTQSADFRGATFTQTADFTMATFTEAASFDSAKFTQTADFNVATFTHAGYFRGAKFTEAACFWEAKFTEAADFSGASFTEASYFSGASFPEAAYFRGVTFTEAAYFTEARFMRGADFREATISGAIVFRETQFRHDVEAEAGLDFSQVRIDHPERVEFYQTDLGQALFFNTDVSKLDFTLVQWRARKRQHEMGRRRLLRWVDRQHSQRLCLFEEDVALDQKPDLQALEGSPDERNYELIAKTYQQLKRNYDAKGDYWTAGHWHYSEMEMQRMHCDWKPRWARWLKQNLSLVALYKYTSAYGESYTLPLLWLVAVLAFFAVVYPVVGLEIRLHDADDLGKVLRYSNYAAFFCANPGEHPAGLWGVLVHGAMASLSVAGFQRELRYAPSYPWGRLLALLELLLTTTMGALFALAIRRQFKRS